MIQEIFIVLANVSVFMGRHMTPAFRDIPPFLCNSPQRQLLPLWLKRPQSTQHKPQSPCKLFSILLLSQVAVLWLWVKAISLSTLNVLHSLPVKIKHFTQVKRQVECEYKQNSNSLSRSLADAPFIHIFSFCPESCCLFSFLPLTPSISQSVHPNITILSQLAACLSWANSLLPPPYLSCPPAYYNTTDTLLNSNSNGFIGTIKDFSHCQRNGSNICNGIVIYKFATQRLWNSQWKCSTETRR